MAELARYGLLPEDLDSADFDLWPDNVPAVNVFIAMATQWRTGMAGPVGLDYAALPAVLRLVGVPRGIWSDTFECLRVLEEEAMNILGEQRGQ